MTNSTKRLLAVCLLVLAPAMLFSQGLTTAAMNGTVTDSKGQPLPGANIMVVHTPSGTVFGTTSRIDGRYNIPGMRVGGPYTATVSYVGYTSQKKESIFLNLGQDIRISFVLNEQTIDAGQVQVTAERDAIFSAARTGAATSVGKEIMQALPSITGRIEDFARLTPQYNPSSYGFSFAGADNRYNNMTVDGSYFNNSFGLAGQPGDRTGVAPISLEAIEQLQINVAPYDVRQGNFVGAGVNTVTKSGTNEFSASLYGYNRDQDLVGTKAKALTYNPGTFSYNRFGARFSGPIIKNKLFFFVDAESDEMTTPGTTYLANTGGQTVGGNTTRVLESDLKTLSSYLSDKFGYQTGGWQGYDFKTPAKRYIAKIDWAVNSKNKISLRYNQLDSYTDVLLSNSSSLGMGTRRSNTTGLNFENSNYKIKENIKSIVGEWNAIIGSKMANNLIIGYTYNDESRDSRGTFFPFVDILKDGSVYTSFGFEPFTPNNELYYKTFQVQDNFTLYLKNHSLTFGVSGERYQSENIYFPGAQSVYSYSSLDDFYTDANDYLANPNRTTSPVTLRRFQVRWSNIPDQVKPVQWLKVTYIGAYAQDEWQTLPSLRLTAGLRVDVPFFDKTAYDNPVADAMTFRDENGQSVKYNTGKMPDANPLFSPRIGFNWDMSKERTTQVRGGTGIFTGKPAFVWISNQVGNTGVLTGFEAIDNTKTRPWNPNPDAYKPTNVTGAPASSFELALTDPSFKFPQVWRSNIGVDQKLPWGLIGSAEFMYSKDVNGIYYINANLPEPSGYFTGADNRPRWTSGNKINSIVANNIVMKNQNVGYAWNATASLEKPFNNGLYAKLAYNYGVSKNTIDPGSVAYGSWSGNQIFGNPNNAGLGFQPTSQGPRVLGTISYRMEYFNFGATTISLYGDGYSPGRYSFTYNGDLNGDGGTSNDLIYIPKDKSEMNFVAITGSVPFTAAQQADAWETFIQQDKYLSKHRGQYAERNGAMIPMVYRLDLSITQDLFANLFKKRNTLQLRVDFLNVTNMINKDWGVAQRYINAQPLIVTTTGGAQADAQGKAQYKMRVINNQLMSKTYEQSLAISDVYRIQFGIRYNFN
jgi:hypothetical protein